MSEPLDLKVESEKPRETPESPANKHVNVLGQAFDRIRAKRKAERESQQRKNFHHQVEWDYQDEAARMSALEGYARWMLEDYNLLGRPEPSYWHPGVSVADVRDRSGVTTPDGHGTDWASLLGPMQVWPSPYLDEVQLPNTVDTVRPLVGYQLADGRVFTDYAPDHVVYHGNTRMPPKQDDAHMALKSALSIMETMRKMLEDNGILPPDTEEQIDLPPREMPKQRGVFCHCDGNDEDYLEPKNMGQYRNCPKHPVP